MYKYCVSWIKKNYLITYKGITEDISFNLDFSLYMYKDSGILNLKSEDAWSTILKLQQFHEIASEALRN